MKKTVFLLSTLYFILSTASPVQAASFWQKLFPPLQIKDQTERKAPNEAIAPEIPSNDSYSNTLTDDTANCSGNGAAGNSWSADDHKTDVTKIDKDGNKYTEKIYQDYNAENLGGEIDLKNLSNEYYRNFQSFFARGSIKCTEDKAKNSFLSLEMNGSSASLRSLPTNQINYHRSQFLTDAAMSLNNSEPLDTVAQDYQIAWDCQGTCLEMSQDETKTSSCRPVYLSELVFGLQNELLYYPTPESQPENFPSKILTPVLSHYSGNCGTYGCYSERSGGKPFIPLPKEDYLLFYKQLNYIPKGNVNSRVTVTNYRGFDIANDQPINPVDETHNRTLPNAAAAYSPQSSTLSFVNPIQQQPLPDGDLCNSKVSPQSSRDKPQSKNIATFVLGLIQRVLAGNNFNKSVSIPTASTYDNKIVKNVQVSEQAFSNMIPSESLEKKKLLEEKFSSKTPANDQANVVDPGYRSDLLYQEMRSLLRPASW